MTAAGALRPSAPARSHLLLDGSARVVVSGRLDPADAVMGAGNLSLLVGVDKPGGREQALAARGGLLADADLALDHAVFAEQVHGAEVAAVGAGDGGRGAFDVGGAVAGADALVTTDAGLGLVVLAADCVPLALVATGSDEAAGGVAAVHAGRRGLVAGVVPAAVGALAEATGRRPGAMTALIGPAIGGCCYEVPADLAAAVAAAVPAAAARTSWGTPALDLRAGVEAQLRVLGVDAVAWVGGCTRCEPAWFSHRASQEGARAEGRHGLVVARTVDR